MFRVDLVTLRKISNEHASLSISPGILWIWFLGTIKIGFFSRS